MHPNAPQHPNSLVIPQRARMHNPEYQQKGATLVLGEENGCCLYLVVEDGHCFWEKKTWKQGKREEKMGVF